MKKIELKKGWRLIADGEEREVSLPCALPTGGSGAFSTSLPVCKGKTFLEVDGASGGADIYVGGQCIASQGSARRLTDVSGLLDEGGELRIALNESGALTRGVSLFRTEGDAFIRPYGVFVTGKVTDNGGAELEMTVDTCNLGGKRRLSVACFVYLGRRRMGRRKKTYTVMPGERSFVVPVSVSRFRPYEGSAPSMYTARVTLTCGDDVLDVSETVFGIRSRAAFSPSDKLAGCTLSQTGGVPGALCFPEAERRKLSALRDLGYNAVRYVGCPSDAALTVADELGMRVIVDIFDNWSHPDGGRCGDNDFAFTFKDTADLTVRVLRDHPSVVMYSIGNAPDESYGRAGADREAEIVSVVRSLDPTRPVTAALSEKVPLVSELLDAGFSRSRISLNSASPSGLLSLGREAGLFAKRTEAFASMLDIYGYSDRYDPYPHTDKPIIGLATRPDDAFAALSDMETDRNIIGDMSDCGMDSEIRGLYASGDIDATCVPRVAGIYRSVLLGAHTSCITSSADASTPALDSEQIWYWPDREGERVTVRVFTPGDVVALYLNGKLVSRRLAGRVNAYIATFDVEYRPGTLEAISYARGREICRTTLSTAGEGRSIKLLTGTRTLHTDAGEIAYIDAWVMDADGRVAVTGAELVTFTVEGEGELLSAGSELGKAPGNTVPASGGHAVAVVRGTAPGKLTVKATAEGLRFGRTSIRVK